MKRLSARIGTVLGVGVLLTASACRDRLDIQQPPNVAMQERSLAEVKAGILSNDAALVTLTAECRAVVSSPLLRPAKLETTLGRLVLAKPRKIHLTLEGPGQKYIELVGDGSQYVVRMPVFNLPDYGGQYDEPVQLGDSAIHLMPDDVADALDLGSLWAGKSLVLTAYPPRWDIAAGSIQRPVIYPGTFNIDSIVVDQRRQPQVAVHNSLLIDRATEQILRLDKFRWNGSLKVRIWYLNWGIARAPDGSTARVPGELIIWYPPPLEGTIVRLRLYNRKINVPVPEGAFDLQQQPQRARP